MVSYVLIRTCDSDDFVRTWDSRDFTFGCPWSDLGLRPDDNSDHTSDPDVPDQTSDLGWPDRTSDPYTLVRTSAQVTTVGTPTHMSTTGSKILSFQTGSRTPEPMTGTYTHVYLLRPQIQILPDGSWLQINPPGSGTQSTFHPGTLVGPWPFRNWYRSTQGWTTNYGHTIRPWPCPDFRPRPWSNFGPRWPRLDHDPVKTLGSDNTSGSRTQTS